MPVTAEVPNSWSREMTGRGVLPARYGESYQAQFVRIAQEQFAPGASVLDLGSGRDPAFAPEDRPAGMHYAGLDISRDELEAAPPGSYDATHVADASQFRPELADRFDLIVSWQAFEHIKPLDPALDNLHAYLKPGGRLVALLSGRFSAFALANQALPSRVSGEVAARVLRVPPHDVFPAHYHRCHDRGLRRALDRWSDVEIHPLYRGAVYFRFSKLALRTYLAYENAACERRLRNLATHYLASARRS